MVIASRIEKRCVLVHMVLTMNCINSPLSRAPPFCAEKAPAPAVPRTSLGQHVHQSWLSCGRHSIHHPTTLQALYLRPLRLPFPHGRWLLQGKKWPLPEHNPLHAKQDFRVWYPSGQRLKVIWLSSHLSFFMVWAKITEYDVFFHWQSTILVTIVLHRRMKSVLMPPFVE